MIYWIKWQTRGEASDEGRTDGGLPGGCKRDPGRFGRMKTLLKKLSENFWKTLGKIPEKIRIIW